MTETPSHFSPSSNRGLCPLNPRQGIGTCDRAAGGDSGSERAASGKGEPRAVLLLEPINDIIGMSFPTIPGLSGGPWEPAEQTHRRQSVRLNVLE
jgi:hypothetical protein